MATIQVLRSLLKLQVEAKGFDRVLDKVKLISCGNGGVVAEMKVEEEHTNYLQTLHGGMTATIVDIFTTLGRFTHPNGTVPDAVSVNININYLNAAKLGDEIVITTATNKCGKNLSYLEVKITQKTSGKVIATGTQTEFLFR